MRRWLTIVLAAAIACAGLGGCGSDGGGDADATGDTVKDYVPPEGASVADWQAQMTGLCQALAARADPFAGRAEPDDPDEAMALIAEFLPIYDEGVLALANVPPPAGRLRDLEQLQLDLEAMRATIARTAVAVDARDARAAYAMLLELNRQGVELNGRLDDLGVPACTA